MKDCKITVKVIDEDGVDLKVWRLVGDYISVDFGLGDNKKDDIPTIKVVFRIKEQI